MPVLEPAAQTNHLTAAYARMTDARYTLGILESCGMAHVSVSLEAVNDGRGGVAMVLLRVEVDQVERSRVLAAISGGNGIPVPDPTTFAARSEWVA